MSKYLLISALFGFVFNNFVFGTDKFQEMPYILPVRQCVIIWKQHHIYLCSKNVSDQEMIETKVNNYNYVLRKLLDTYDFGDGDDNLSSIPFSYGCTGYEKKGTKYYFTIGPSRAYVYDFSDVMKINREEINNLCKIGYKFIENKNILYKTINTDWCNSDLRDTIVRLISLPQLKKGDGNCLVLGDFDITVEFKAYRQQMSDMPLSCIELYRGVYPYYICIHFHKKVSKSSDEDGSSKHVSEGKDGVDIKTGGGVDSSKIGGGSGMVHDVDGMVPKVDGVPGMNPEIDCMMGPKVDGVPFKLGKTGGSKDGEEGGSEGGEKGDEFSDGEKKLPGKGLGLGNIRIHSGGSSGSGSSSGSSSKSKKKRCGCKCSGK